FELPSESRNQIERGMKFGKLAKRLRHAVVVLEGVQARPRQNITARFRVLVLRLMHVPQHNQMDAVHSEGVPKQGWHRWLVAVCRGRFKVDKQERPMRAAAARFAIAETHLGLRRLA